MIIEGIRKISKDFTQRMIFFGLIVLIFVLPIPQFFKSIYLTKDILIQTTLLRVFLIYFTFFFVTEVLGEKLPYQAYPEIERITGKKGTFCTKRAKDLFRITNYTKPASCIAVESPVAASVMALAKPSALTYSLTKQKEEKEEQAAEHLERTDFRMLHGDICKTLEDAVKIAADFTRMCTFTKQKMSVVKSMKN